jgi:hypothetical protein
VDVVTLREYAGVYSHYDRDSYRTAREASWRLWLKTSPLTRPFWQHYLTWEGHQIRAKDGIVFDPHSGLLAAPAARRKILALMGIDVAEVLWEMVLEALPRDRDEVARDLPPIMAKGIFTRERRTVEERKKKDGRKEEYIQIEQPKLRLCVLDLRTGAYHDLGQGTKPSGARTIGAFNAADLLKYYGIGLARIMLERCPPLFNPSDERQEIPIPPLGLEPFEAQKPAIRASIMLVARGINVDVLGEVGVGKTLTTLAVVEAFGPQHHQRTKEELCKDAE